MSSFHGQGCVCRNCRDGIPSMRPTVRERKVSSLPPSQAVSLDWVLNQLAGLTFPEQGQAHDYIRECFERSKRIQPVKKAIIPREEPIE